MWSKLIIFSMLNRKTSALRIVSTMKSQNVQISGEVDWSQCFLCQFSHVVNRHGGFVLIRDVSTISYKRGQREMD